MSEIKSVRRFYLLKRIVALQTGDEALSAFWHGKQDEIPAPALPATFPKLATLAAVGYSTTVDFDGADADELIEYVKLSRRDADAVIAAHAAL